MVRSVFRLLWSSICSICLISTWFVGAAHAGVAIDTYHDNKPFTRTIPNVINSAHPPILQLYLEGFKKLQANKKDNRCIFHVTLNDEPVTALEDILNTIPATNNVMTINIPMPTHLYNKFKTETTLTLRISDVVHGVGHYPDDTKSSATIVKEIKENATIYGTVKDAAGNPITGAQVSVALGPTTTTAADGSYILTNVREGTVLVQAVKPTFEASVIAISAVSDVKTPCDFVLVKSLNTNLPVIKSFTINADETYAYNSKVTLNVNAIAYNGSKEITPATTPRTYVPDKMFISLDGITGEWIPYTSSFTYTLPSGEGIKTLFVQVEDSNGLRSIIATDTIELRERLESLNIQGATLAPDFDPNRYSYTTTVNYTNSLTVLPVPEDKNATVTVRCNGEFIDSTPPRWDVPLQSNTTNTIEIIVTALDGSVSSTYRIAVPTGIKVAASLTDDIISMNSGNTTISANNSWIINVTAGTVKTNISKDDLLITDLPNGVTFTAAKDGASNAIIVTLSTTNNANTPLISTLTPVKIVVKSTAVSEANAANSNELTATLHPYRKITTTLTDNTVTMAPGNSSVSADNSWLINVTSGTVKETVSIEDLTISGLPAGLSATVTKDGANNAIKVTIDGKTSSPIGTTIPVFITVKGSAVTEPADNADQLTASLKINLTEDTGIRSLSLYDGAKTIQLTPVSGNPTLYQYVVPNEVTAVALQVVAVDPGASITFPGTSTPVQTGVGYLPISNLSWVGNQRTITVTSGSAQQNYTVQITRRMPNYLPNKAPSTTITEWRT
ncbi:cadherin-like beta sandwich domain-containing protein [Heliophilum fasciatum]|uniref:Carboxypeptidase family protein n=1 Tax=Heliophilum fasciatum TaxID=35700 RepID=A0A4R2RZF8_9FIRM|nr:cadherin-like beta sandwich domain-containing protein [Heliophilum fasciatum]MCW2276639.1 hypothetical protein [Heliophilum fasciatum]TCP68978.1 carboxypeptidase family protein [Heliophilum fasciatum]